MWERESERMRSAYLPSYIARCTYISSTSTSDEITLDNYGSATALLHLRVARTAKAPRSWEKAMTTVSSSGATPAPAPTTKPWFLTFNPGSKDILVWKNGARLKLRDGSTSGQVTAVSVLSVPEKTVTVSD